MIIEVTENKTGVIKAISSNRPPQSKHSSSKDEFGVEWGRWAGFSINSEWFNSSFYTFKIIND